MEPTVWGQTIPFEGYPNALVAVAAMPVHLLLYRDLPVAEFLPERWHESFPHPSHLNGRVPVPSVRRRRAVPSRDTRFLHGKSCAEFSIKTIYPTRFSAVTRDQRGHGST